MKLKLFILCILVYPTGLYCSLSSSFKKFDIVPSIIPAAPQQLLQVTYLFKIQVHPGETLLKLFTAFPPALKWPGNPDKFYLLIFFDPDLPFSTRPPFSMFLHWAVGNIPGDDVTKGETLAPYVSPMPPGLKPHRYIFLIYEQPKRLDYTINLFKLRFSASLRTIMNAYNLSDPFAGNFFLEQY